MPDPATARNHIALILRAEMAGVRARLIGEFRDFDLAEDALQDALMRAWEHWPGDGLPDRPAAWLYRVAQRRALDRLRHDRIVRRASQPPPDAEEPADPADPAVLIARADFDDDLLRLMFTCCHPVLRPEVRAALTLRTALDLTLEQVARAFLVEPRTMEQRLVRARKRLREQGIDWRVPAGPELDARLNDVLRVAYLIFTEGYAATSGEALLRRELCTLAIGLTRRLVRMQRGHAEALALLALMLLQDARSGGRLDASGHLVLLEAQDRSRWDPARIREGRVLLEKALLLRQAPGPYQIQAAIAALHAEAGEPGATDWAQICALYDTLMRLQDTPVVRLNRAVAVAMSRGAAAGLLELDRLKRLPALTAFHPFHAARGALLVRLERPVEALACYRTALGLARNGAEVEFLRARVAELETGAG